MSRKLRHGCGAQPISKRLPKTKGSGIMVSEFIPKFHCELNPIECVWGQAKRYTGSHTNFTLTGLRRIIETALDSVTLDNIRKYFRKARDYERAYREYHQAREEVELGIKVYQSHRRIFNEDLS